MTRAAIYLRQSLDRTGEGAAVARQLAACEELCGQRGWPVVEVFNDNDTSASSKKPRKDYQRLLRDVRAGLFDVVVVWDLDRLTRRPIEVEEWMELNEERGTNLVSIGENIDLSTDNGRLFLRIKAAVARAEVDRKGARQKAGNRSRAMAGEPFAGPVPFGYRRQVERNAAGKVVSSALVPEASEAEAVRDAYERVLKRHYIRTIAADWAAAGLCTTAGKPWSSHALSKLLLRPVYAGIVVYDGKELGKGNWPALVDEKTWRSAVARLRDPSRRTASSYARRHLLPGLAICGVEGCGSKVASGRSHRGVQTYVCSGARHMARAAAPVDEFISAVVVERLSRDDARELLSDETSADVAALTHEAQILRAREDELALMLGRGVIKPRQFEQANAEVAAELARVEAELSRGDRASVLRDVVGKDAGAVWAELDLAPRRAIIGELMTITMRPPGRGTKRFDRTQIEVVWR